MKEADMKNVEVLFKCGEPDPLTGLVCTLTKLHGGYHSAERASAVWPREQCSLWGCELDRGHAGSHTALAIYRSGQQL